MKMENKHAIRFVCLKVLYISWELMGS